VSGLLHHTCFLLVVLVLFKLFKPLDRNLAWLMLALGLSSIPIMMANMLNQFAAVVLLSDADYLTAFTPDQLETLTMVFLDLHSHGYYVAGLFSGLFLLPGLVGPQVRPPPQVRRNHAHTRIPWLSDGTTRQLRLPERAPRTAADVELDKLRKRNDKLTAELERTRLALEITGKAHALLELLSDSAATENRSTK
jgi:hypothetical protein